MRVSRGQSRRSETAPSSSTGVKQAKMGQVFATIPEANQAKRTAGTELYVKSMD